MEQKSREAYDKGIKIIQSCNTPDHILAAKKYVNNFFVSSSVPYKGRKVVISTEGVRILYQNLLKLLNKRQQELVD